MYRGVRGERNLRRRWLLRSKQRGRRLLVRVECRQLLLQVERNPLALLRLQLNRLAIWQDHVQSPVLRKTGSRRNQATDDHVLLQPDKTPLTPAWLA